VGLSFDQRDLTGAVRFVGMAGITEAPITPGAARRAGLVNLFPHQKVDCRLVRHPDGSVVIPDLKLAAGVDPQASAADQAAAEAKRYRLHISRNKWMH
jgi:hypothetical protein